MNLRSKVILAGSLFIFLQVALVFFVFYYTIYPTVEKLEEGVVEKSLHRGLELLQRELYHLEQLGQAMSYRYLIQNIAIKNTTPSILESDALIETMFNTELNLMYILNKDKKVLWENIYDLVNDQSFPRQMFLSTLWKNFPGLLEHTSLLSLQAGIYNSPLGPMWIVSTPIAELKNRQNIAGILIVGKIITPEMMQLIQSMSFSNIRLYPMGGALLSKKQELIIHKIASSDADFIAEPQGKYFNGYMTLSDLSGKPQLLLSTVWMRNGSNIFKACFYATVLIILLIDFIFFVATFLIIRQSLITPLRKLSKDILELQSETMFEPHLGHAAADIQRLGHALERFMKNQQARIIRESTQAYREGEEETCQDLQFSFEDGFRSSLDQINRHEKKLFDLPINDLEWVIAESKAGALKPEKYLEYAEKLESINEALRHYQRETRQSLYDLQRKILRNATLIRAYTRHRSGTKKQVRYALSGDSTS